ncbi:MAG: glutathione S-transferase family protein [Candidatus Binataceae bacterium]|jgi:glutathione S-transferase
MAHDLTLWGTGTGRTMRAHWMLLELGLEYEFHPIQARTGETQTEEFRRLNPRHKIPVLRHGQFVLTESAAIIQYLSETFGISKELHVPTDATSRATLNEWCYFIISELDAGSLYVMRRHDNLKHIYGEAPAAIEAAEKYFLHNLEAMAARVESGGPYLLGDRFSAADILLMTCLDWAVSSEIALPDPFSHYRQRVAQRPAYRAALRRNFAP